MCLTLIIFETSSLENRICSLRQFMEPKQCIPDKNDLHTPVLVFFLYPKMTTSGVLPFEPEVQIFVLQVKPEVKSMKN